MSWYTNDDYDDARANADEAAAYNENYYRYLTEEEHVDPEEAYRMVYGS
ncbi:hypothetical protein [Anaerocaecibacter muris]|nr:hypothetical protein [Anaerocaecibacter muris]